MICGLWFAELNQDALGERVCIWRQSAFGAFISPCTTLAFRLHMSLYNPYTALPTAYRVVGLLNKRPDLLFQSSLLETCQAVTEALNQLQQSRARPKHSSLIVPKDP